VSLFVYSVDEIPVKKGVTLVRKVLNVALKIWLIIHQKVVLLRVNLNPFIISKTARSYRRFPVKWALIKVGDRFNQLKLSRKWFFDELLDLREFRVFKDLISAC
jgi:hypothetical protein